ncbi:hypothetical protein BDE02_17G025000 [Populus trichocarpa]|nr:hypothetical protein BDE02_17G025000 [Populus trichocarpa]
MSMLARNHGLLISKHNLSPNHPIHPHQSIIQKRLSFFTVDNTPTLQTMRKSTIHRWRESNRPRKEKAVELTLRAVCSQMETVENETNKQPLSLKFLYMYSIHYRFF